MIVTQDDLTVDSNMEFVVQIKSDDMIWRNAAYNQPNQSFDDAIELYKKNLKLYKDGGRLVRIIRREIKHLVVAISEVPQLSL